MHMKMYVCVPVLNLNLSKHYEYRMLLASLRLTKTSVKSDIFFWNCRKAHLLQYLKKKVLVNEAEIIHTMWLLLCTAVTH